MSQFGLHDGNIKESHMAEPRCVVCATVCTGLEFIAVKECKGKLSCASVREGRGRVYCDIPAKSINDVKRLRSVENLFIVVKEFQEDKELDCCSPGVLEKLYKLPQDLDWNSALSLWRQYTGYEGVILKSEQDSAVSEPGSNEAAFTKSDDEQVEEKKRVLEEREDINTVNCQSLAKRRKHSSEDDLEEESNYEETQNSSSENHVDGEETSTKALPKFRVTCTRTGDGHSFSSPEAAAKFGGGINDFFGWRVNLSNPDIEVLLNIVDNNAVIGIALTKESRGKRNIAHFGPTTLRSSIAYCMLHLASIKPGDVVCDPMCGGGSIPIEASLSWPLSLHLCGDNHDLAPPRTLANVLDVSKQQLGKRTRLPLDIYLWNVCNLPLKSNTVDVIVSDLPFGKKSGSKHENWMLYPKALEEMARVCSTGYGRAVLLTHDKRVMAKVLGSSGQWKKELTLWVNMGGLKAGIYVLKRTAKQ